MKSSIRRGISLQLFFSLAISCTTLLMGSLLAWQHYRSVETVMISAAGQTVQQLGKVLTERSRSLIEPPRNVLQVLAYNPLLQAKTAEQRLERLPQLLQSLRVSNVVSAVFVGYPTGEFFLVRKLQGGDLQTRFSAPEGAWYMMRSSTLAADGSLVRQWRFYDIDENLLEIRDHPGNELDPRERPWFQQATQQPDMVLIRPYLYSMTQRTGITLAQRDAMGSGAVVGMDLTISDLNDELADLQVTDNTEVAVLGKNGAVIAFPEREPGSFRIPELQSDGMGVKLPHVSEVSSASLAHVFEHPPADGKPRLYHINERDWYGISVPLALFSVGQSHLVVTVPADELLLEARAEFARGMGWTAGLTLLVLVLGWILSKRLSRPLRLLAEQVRARARFDFSGNMGVKSSFTEVRELSRVLDRMSHAIVAFQSIALALNNETELDRMLDEVVDKLVHALEVEGGAVYLLSTEADSLQLANRCAVDNIPGTIRLNADSAGDLQKAVTGALGEGGHYLCFELNNRQGSTLGVLVLWLSASQQRMDDVQHAFERFARQLSSAAAIAIETRQLLEAQQMLMDAMIKLLANAIDAKSPYTGGHCERVPRLAELLLNQAIATDSGPYAGFKMNEDERYECRIAAWLHDCGKITTPESVMDKATKLEMVYNRIHVIRTRFEVLWRDASVEYWQGLANGGDPQTLQETLQRRQAQLQEDFAFVAQVNIGGESLDDEDIERLREIGAQRWQRNFDRSLGLARHELERLGPQPETLPSQAYLLSDRPEHRVPWGDHKPPVDKDDPANIWGFDMQVPELAYNHGELYNLSIRRGTLTPEERFRVNEHIIQTIIMLSSLPLPPHLKRVPHIAGTHHEKMDGTGYPRRLCKEDLGVPERVMMIADIFEALTASDRPYKAPKTLTESLAIMTDMALNGHIDIDMFRLFLQERVYLTYAKLFLLPAQIDEVDEQVYLKRLDAAADT
ncbi:phosphohydrolase [Pusillimonas sp. MFBS29]|uniref:HD domain-containing phosphohydrolase n=1 Tax=Pusillimonas sp. MFBS29 TaxID=2886690 RepID=UPI001D11FB9D|nr:HD domain-containing phosphohydrolase [Pusillimonas sp. MFBS29]MCC2596160.1 phosphohydrolase [Pusillimonas sp. MFBS29]